MNLPTLIMALWALLMPASNASPCGLCREDNRAAVYSYEADQKVKADPERLEFVVLKVTGPLPRETVASLISWLAERGGVDSSTLKVSASQKSIGFVFEKKYSKEALILDLAKNFPPLSFRPLDDGGY